MATQNGTDIILMVDGQRFAAATANEFNISRAMRDITNKDTGGWKKNAYGLAEASMNGTGLFLTSVTNLLAYSEALNNAWWVKTGLTIDSTKVNGPDGLKNAFNITALTASDTLNSSLLTLEVDSSICFSIWVKGTGDIDVVVGDELIDASTPATLSGSWQRISVTLDTDTGIDCYCGITIQGATSLQVYGPQLEYGTTPTAYQPSGNSYNYFADAIKNKTEIACMITNQKDYTLSGTCLVSNLTLAAPMEENTTFTADFSVSGLVIQGTI